jgi:hypothetical protein
MPLTIPSSIQLRKFYINSCFSSLINIPMSDLNLSSSILFKLKYMSMKSDINCILAGFNFNVTNNLKHSALTFGLSSGFDFIHFLLQFLF